MAEAQRSLLKSSDSLGNIRKSLMSFNDGLRSANSTSTNIIKDLNSGNREKSRSILKKSELFEARRQAVQRKEREDVIESGKIGSIVGSATRRITASSKGFLGRVMDFVGTIFVGWILTNLPVIIKSVQSLIGRIRELRSILQNWINGVSEFFSDFSISLDVYLNRILGITDDGTVAEAEKNRNKLESSSKKILNDIQKMIDDFQNFNLATYLKKLITGESGDSTVRGGGNESTPTAGRFKPILDLIGSAEGGYTSIAPRDSNPNLTSMTIAQANKAVGIKGGKGAIGRYQLTNPIGQAKAAGLDPNKDLFSPENQDKIALALIRGRGITADMIINNPTEAARRLAMEFAGIPVLAPTQGYVQPVERGQSYYRGYNRNAATIKPEAVEAAFKKFKEEPNPTFRSGPAPKIDKSTRYRKGENVSSVVGAPAVITSLQGAPRSHGQHGGIDIGCASGLYVSLRVDCEILGTKYERYGYGHVIDVWIPSLKVQLRFAHSSRHLITKQGEKVPAGTSFTITGSTGRSSGPHIHLEADSRYNKMSYGGNLQADPYVALIRLTSTEIKGVSKPTTAAEISSAQSTTQTTTTSQAENLTPTRKPKNIPVPMIDPTLPPGKQQSVGEGGGPPPPPSKSSVELSTGDELNRFMNLILLTELGNV